MYQKSVDIWSLGVVVFTMFSMGKHPFWLEGGETKKSYLEKIKNLQWSFWPENMDK